VEVSEVSWCQACARAFWVLDAWLAAGLPLRTAYRSGSGRIIIIIIRGLVFWTSGGIVIVIGWDRGAGVGEFFSFQFLSLLGAVLNVLLLLPLRQDLPRNHHGIAYLVNVEDDFSLGFDHPFARKVDPVTGALAIKADEIARFGAAVKLPGADDFYPCSRSERDKL
jgi:hypothetical protein